MKICFLVDAWTPVWGGGQAHVWEVSRRLAKDYGVSVDIIVPNLKGLDPKGVTPIGPRFTFPHLAGRLLYALSVFIYCLTHHYDLYHSHNYSTSLPLLPLKLLGRKTAFTLHGAGVKGLGGGVFNHFGFPALLADFFLYQVPYDLRFSAAKSSLKPNHLSDFIVTANGVNVSDFDSPPEVKHSGIRLLWLGRFDPVKGLDLLLSAFFSLGSKYSSLSLTLVGSGPDKNRIQKLAGKNVFFLSAVSGTQKIKIFKSSDIFVLPSLSEGLPLTILEAMAAKLPVVATKVGDIPSLVISGKTGYLAEPGSISSLSAALEKAILNKNRKTLGLSGYNLVKTSYTWDKVAARVYLAYQKIL